MKNFLMAFLLLPFVLSGTTITDGLIAWYKFDGDATDSSGNGNHGVVHGATVTAGRDGGEKGAYSFDGNDDWIEVPHSSSFATIESEYTISFWIKPMSWWDKKSNADPAIPFVCKADTAYAEGSFRIFAEKSRAGIVTISGYSDYLSDELLTLGSWQHYVFVNSDSSRLYRDGVLIAQAGRACNILHLEDTLAIGRDIVGGTTQFLDGLMDDLRIYNRALSTSEVSAIYKGGGSDSEETVLHCVTFNATGGTVVTGSCRVEDDSKVGALPTATREGYEFLGWFTAADGGSLVDSDTVVTADVTYYAHWQMVDCDYSSFNSDWTAAGALDLSSGCRSVNGPIMIAYGASWFEGGMRVVIRVDDVVFFDATGDGETKWEDLGAHLLTLCVYDAQGVQVGETYSAEIERIGSEYKVQFNANGGVGNVSVIYGLRSEARILPENGFTRSGYGFSGWSSGVNIAARWQPGDPITSVIDEYGNDVTLYACWNWIPHGETEVSEVVTGGKRLKIDANWITDSLVKRYGASTKERFLQKFGDDLSKALLKSTVKVNGQAMQVWQDYVAGTDPTDSNSVFTAKVRVENGLPVVEWEPNLNSNGEERVYTVWGKTNLADAVWHTPTNECSKFFKVDVAMPETKGEVSFDLGDASGAIDSFSVCIGQPFGELPTPTRSGYQFKGWFTEADGGTEVTAETIVMCDMTIYAHWESPLLHRWSFNGDLIDSVGEQTAKACGSVTIGSEECSLPGGSRGIGYIDLGTNLIHSADAPLTFEIWAKLDNKREWGRILEIGTDKSNYFSWLWSKGSSAIDDDSVEFYHQGTAKFSKTDLLAPFDVGQLYHLSMTIDPDYGGSGSARVTWAKRDATTGEVLASQYAEMPDEWFSFEFRKATLFLGHSQNLDTGDACASYNEVRIWNKVLTDAELTESAKSGPDALPNFNDALSDASYKSFLNCSSTTIWSGVQLSQVTNIVGYLSGKGINGGTNAVRVVGCCFKDETDGKSVQFQAALGDYIKCVKVRLMQAGNDVCGYVQYAGCLDRSHGVGVDFDNEKYTVKFVATSDSGEWYGVKNLRAFVNQTQDLADATSLYCVIDLSELNSDGRYEVSCLTNVPAGGWTDEYKTTKLVLRRIEAGSFIMGEDQADESHRVTLTNPFYIGVFEVTQKQWNLVMGDNPAGTSYNTRPIVNVSYDDVRGSTLGAEWPTSGDVDAASFVGIISTRTGLHMELPTEAQWEYAARAGTQGKYANAGSFNTSYIHCQASASTEVGSKLPNDWGVYDMLGNVWELCRDWFGDLEYGDDPVGVATATERMRRGGSYDDCWDLYSNVIFRMGVSPSSKDDGVGHANIGFRLVLEP